jgi:GNAT superfamily N-acetyltransferase
VVSEVRLDSIPESIVVVEGGPKLVPETCRTRAVADLAGFPDARRGKSGSRLRSPGRRRKIIRAEVTSETTPMFTIPLPEGMAASGASRLHIRTAAESDVDRLAEYFGTLSQPSRYNRFMGAVTSFSKAALDCMLPNYRVDRFTLIAELQEDSRETVIGEASYAHERQTRLGEFAISVCDHWQRRGLGSALLSALQSRAVSLGHSGLFGETFKTNDQMKALARKTGFVFGKSDDWRLVRFDKQLPDQSRGAGATTTAAPSLWWPEK